MILRKLWNIHSYFGIALMACRFELCIFKIILIKRENHSLEKRKTIFVKFSQITELFKGNENSHIVIKLIIKPLSILIYLGKEFECGTKPVGSQEANHNQLVNVLPIFVIVSRHWKTLALFPHKPVFPFVMVLNYFTTQSVKRRVLQKRDSNDVIEPVLRQPIRRGCRDSEVFETFGIHAFLKVPVEEEDYFVVCNL